MTQPYAEAIDRKNPTFFLFMVDQSGSMMQPFDELGDRTMAEGVATAINKIIRELVLRCSKGHKILDYYYIGLIGYNSQINLGFGGKLDGQFQVPVSEVGTNPLRIETRVKKTVDDVGNILETTEKFLVWIDPVSKGKTKMHEAFGIVKESVTDFVESFPDSFPPIVINITDGVPTDAGDAPYPALEATANEIRSVTNANGSHPLLFNIHIWPKKGEPVMFPAREDQLDNLYSRVLFRMSSPFTEKMVGQANMQESEQIVQGSRGFVFQGDLVSVIRLLEIGTRVGRDQR